MRPISSLPPGREIASLLETLRNEEVSPPECGRPSCARARDQVTNLVTQLDEARSSLTKELGAFDLKKVSLQVQITNLETQNNQLVLDCQVSEYDLKGTRAVALLCVAACCSHLFSTLTSSRGCSGFFVAVALLQQEAIRRPQPDRTLPYPAQKGTCDQATVGSRARECSGTR